MSDALENLKKLPMRCAAVVAGNVCFIRRGAKEPDTAFIPFDEVDRWNRDHSVTDAQVQAMIVGVTLGWDQDGADCDVHARVLGRDDEIGPFLYEFQGEVYLQLRVEAYTLEQAQRTAREVLQIAADLSTEDDSRIVSAGPSDTLDLVDSNDPRS